jgi:DNA topoisomerase-1
VTDGATNASLPRGMTPEEVTLEKALELLADRAAKGPVKRSAASRPSRRAAAAKPSVSARAPAKIKTTKAKKAKKAKSKEA